MVHVLLAELAENYRNRSPFSVSSIISPPMYQSCCRAMSLGNLAARCLSSRPQQNEEHGTLATPLVATNPKPGGGGRGAGRSGSEGFS